MRIKISADGTLQAIDHKDTLDKLNLGVLEKPRISEVEWDSASQEWIAIRKSDGKIIARGKNREAVVATEHQVFESEL